MTETERHVIDGEESSSDILITHFPLLDSRAVRRQPKTVDDLPPELLEQIHDHAVLENGLPYLNTAWASTDRTDTYYTRMLQSSLQNFADDATAGISIQNSHHVDEQSLGRTYRGTYKHQRAVTPARAEMDFYIPPGLVVNGTSTDHIIQGIRWGTVSDVSVGFYGGNVRCAMCQKPMMRDLMSLMLFGGGDDEAEVRDPASPCGHLPGLEYNVRDHEGKKTGERQIAVGEIDGAHCAELSFVFDGATPQAKIAGRMVPVFAKAYRMAELEVLPKDVAFQLENRFRGVHFPNITKPKFFVPATTGSATVGYIQSTTSNGTTLTVYPRPDMQTRAEWDTAYKNDLPDSAFAYVEPGEKDDEGKTVPRSKRHFPHHDKSGKVDLPHLRNALARVEGGQSEHAGKARAHLERHAKAEGIGDRMDDENEERVLDEHFHDEPPSPDSGEEKRAKKPTATAKDDSTQDDEDEDDQPKSKRGTKEKVRMTEVSERATERSRAEELPPAASPPDMRQVLIATGLAPEDFGGDVSLRLQEISRELSDLREWADIGRQAREHLCEEVRKAGVRAYGARSFKPDAYGPILQRGSYKELQMLLEQFEEFGSLRFQGGRATSDEEESTNHKVPAETMKVPARAYRS